MPYAVGLGVRLSAASAGEVRGELDWAPRLCTAGGVLHGGALMSLADAVGAVCAFLNLPEGASTSTVESSTHFFRAVRGGTVAALATPLHTGRSFVTVQTELYGEQGRLVGRTTQTQAVQVRRPD
ncbi:PaaI family thioesterase [Kitasatospora sp. NBC_01250]|uniref:PaaI family thioesterase n=1 Tax=unclassified Kitasatospora TaxID=2633591 RepID=UPI002E1620C8|nr:MULTISPECIES: PaaI family thioesterase [unclassified Kitasatospora]WSJ71945.1 PaaI family thioesterase [Kitasatospora sp. NBC_01302]